MLLMPLALYQNFYKNTAGIQFIPESLPYESNSSSSDIIHKISNYHSLFSSSLASSAGACSGAASTGAGSGAASAGVAFISTTGGS